MGFIDWVKGFSERFSSPASGSSYNLETVLLPNESMFLAKGTSYRQENLRRLGLGTHEFILNPERDNKIDPLAVMVQGVNDGAGLHVGYLPKGSNAQGATHRLGQLMMEKSEVILITGEILEGDSGLIVRLHMPNNSTVRQMIHGYEKTTDTPAI
jgi:hypothetical protein